MQHPSVIIPLCNLPLHHPAIIIDLATEEELKEKLQTLGFLPGTPILCIGTGPQGSPRAYCIRGCVIALRQKDSKTIMVREVNEIAKRL